MSKTTSVTINLDEDTYNVFQTASEIVSNAGVRISTGQLVQTIVNSEMPRLTSRKIAQRFLKSIIRQVGELAQDSSDDDEDGDDELPEIPLPKPKGENSSPMKETVNSANTESKLRAPLQ